MDHSAKAVVFPLENIYILEPINPVLNLCNIIFLKLIQGHNNSS